MKVTIRKETKSDYSMHDMRIAGYKKEGSSLEIKLNPGIIKIKPPCDIVEGYVEFENVDWAVSYAYVINLTNTDWDIKGKKYKLEDFIEKYEGQKFNILDECHGTNIIKLSGYLSEGSNINECFIEIVYMGNLKYHTEK